MEAKKRFDFYNEFAMTLFKSLVGTLYDKIEYELDLCSVDTDSIHFAPIDEIPIIPSYVSYPSNQWPHFFDYKHPESQFCNENYSVYVSRIDDGDFALLKLNTYNLRQYCSEEKTKLILFLFEKFFSSDHLNYSANDIESHVSKYLIEYFNIICVRFDMRTDTTTFHDINTISKLRYENAAAFGSIALTCDLALNFSIRFEAPILFCEHRKVRKLLEITSQDYFMISNGKYIYGFTEANKLDSDYYLITIYGAEKWTFFYGCEALFKVYNGVTVLSVHNEEQILFSKLYELIFNKKAATQWDIVESARTQKHGTMLVFTKEAMEESKRLSSSCFVLEKSLDLSAIEFVSAIDGALLLDEEGALYAIGVILDGTVDSNTLRNSSRGARYNSAIAYSNNHTDNCLIIVVSEDGDVNIIANGTEAYRLI